MSSSPKRMIFWLLYQRPLTRTLPYTRMSLKRKKPFGCHFLRPCFIRTPSPNRIRPGQHRVSPDGPKAFCTAWMRFRWFIIIITTAAEQSMSRRSPDYHQTPSFNWKSKQHVPISQPKNFPSRPDVTQASGSCVSLLSLSDSLSNTVETQSGVYRCGPRRDTGV
ncbi:unnamed protein product [Menidia menidia]|uniref:(Atlantic silverside) hypothetical protein n=1 Tax=Menidia menidia TaxID=238744 RepID=A0A8S4ATK4_9TELE|nr:unnamed protein product [Menidia menidia]